MRTLLLYGLTCLLGPLPLGLLTTTAQGAPPVSKPVVYQEGDTNLEGQLVLDPALQGKRPVILLAHEQGPSLLDTARERESPSHEWSISLLEGQLGAVYGHRDDLGIPAGVQAHLEWRRLRCHGSRHASAKRPRRKVRTTAIKTLAQSLAPGAEPAGADWHP